MVGCLSVSAERGLSSAVGTLSPYCKPIGQDLAAAVAKSTAVGPVPLPGSLPSTNEDTNPGIPRRISSPLWRKGRRRANGHLREQQRGGSRGVIWGQGTCSPCIIARSASRLVFPRFIMQVQAFYPIQRFGKRGFNSGGYQPSVAYSHAP